MLGMVLAYSKMPQLCDGWKQTLGLLPFGIFKGGYSAIFLQGPLSIKKWTSGEFPSHSPFSLLLTWLTSAYPFKNPESGGLIKTFQRLPPPPATFT